MWTAGIHLDQRMNMTLNQPILINKLSVPKTIRAAGKNANGVAERAGKACNVNDDGQTAFWPRWASRCRLGRKPYLITDNHCDSPAALAHRRTLPEAFLFPWRVAAVNAV
ncbi:hypothetical protein GCM10023078_15280 [Gibbsiella greigii]